MMNTRSFPRTCPTLASCGLSRRVRPGKGRWENGMLASGEERSPVLVPLCQQGLFLCMSQHQEKFLASVPCSHPLTLPQEGAVNQLKFGVQVPGMKMSSTPVVLLSPLLGFPSSTNFFSSLSSPPGGQQGGVGLSALPQEKPEPARHPGGEVGLKLQCDLSCRDPSPAQGKCLNTDG